MKIQLGNRTSGSIFVLLILSGVMDSVIKQFIPLCSKTDCVSNHEVIHEKNNKNKKL
jgi:hypothetical protein